jgi:hypothetical protein
MPLSIIPCWKKPISALPSITFSIRKTTTSGKLKFSLPAVAGLLKKYDIDIL